MNFTAGIALALATVLSGNSAQAQTQAMPQAQTVQQYVQSYFADEPVMIAIAGCESHFRQYDSTGNVLHNTSGSSAVGVFQIMDSVHSEAAADMGIDIYTTQGNMAYARYLYETSGTAPWTASKACWSKVPVPVAVAKNTSLAVANK